MVREREVGPPRILFQPPNHVGLGHISRLAAIALRVRELEPLARVAFAVEGGSHMLLESLGLPFISIPSAHILYKTADWKQWSERERRSIALEISRAVLTGVTPDLVVFDCLPSMAMVSAAIERGIPMALCLREMKDTAAHLATMAQVAPHIQAVLVPHEPRTIIEAEPWRSRMHFVGNVARPMGAVGAETKRYSIVVTAGGGGHRRTVDFYNLALEAMAVLLGEDAEMECLLVTGPLFTEWLELKSVAGVRVMPYAADLPALFASASLVVCRGGYNTMAEVAQAGVRAICVPTPCFYDDQHARAAERAEADPGLTVFERGDANALAEVMRRALAAPAAPAKIERGDGAGLAALILLDLIST